MHNNTKRPIKCLGIIIALVFTNVNISYSATIDETKSNVMVQDEGRSSDSSLHISDKWWLDYISDTKNIVTSPTRWEGTDWLKAALTLGITAGLISQDENIHDWAGDNRTKSNDDIAGVAEHFGNGTYVLPSLGLFYLYGHYEDDSKAKQTVLLSIESFIISGVFTQAIKSGAGRHRPYTGDPSNTWGGPSLSFESDHMSFPSGHSQTAFSVATVIATTYDDVAIVPLLAYTLAALTAMQRVYNNKHWASDVFLGSSIGYFTAKAVVKAHDEDGDMLSIMPATDGRNHSIVLSYRY